MFSNVRVSKEHSEQLASDRRKITLPRGLIIVALLGLAVVGANAAMQSDAGGLAELSADLEAETSNQSIPANHQSPPTKFPVEIRKPSGPPRVSTALSDAHGNRVTVACSTCHTTRQPNNQNKTVRDLDEFHVGMAFSHGTVSCLSCHNSNDYDSLKLADDSRVEFSDVMTLCAQCHGPQMNDYQHGAHGGMNGYWDRTRGPQSKNNCVDCHNPHSPQFPKMQPTFKPKDRFLGRHGIEK